MLSGLLYVSYGFFIPLILYCILTGLMNRSKFEAIRVGFYASLIVGIGKVIYSYSYMNGSIVSAVGDFFFRLLGLFLFFLVAIILIEKRGE